MKVIKEMGVRVPANKLLFHGYKVISIDPSSNSLAFSIFEAQDDAILVAYGKIDFPKHAEMRQRYEIINAALPELVERYKPDTIVIEETIYIQNPNTSRLLAYIVGGLMCKSVDLKLRVIDVGPLKWKAYIGYKKVTKKEIDEWAKEHGEKEAKKIAAFERKDRVRAIMFHKFPQLENEDYDIWDAIGIGWWAIHELY
jgi:Holliday junction resolvasome RuvABC endonuclease subunit